jgi:hypothetical protein
VPFDQAVEIGPELFGDERVDEDERAFRRVGDGPDVGPPVGGTVGLGSRLELGVPGGPSPEPGAELLEAQ